MFASKLQAFSPPNVVYATSKQQLQQPGQSAATSSSSPSAYHHLMDQQQQRQSPLHAPQGGRFVGDASGSQSQPRASYDDGEIEDDLAMSGAGGDSISSSYTQDFEDAEGTQSIQVRYGETPSQEWRTQDW